MEQEEIWKTIIIDGEEWNYEVCNLDGKVRNSRTGRILKQSRNKKTGYCTVMLNKDGKGKTFYVHRLVATMFIPNANNYSDVNHKNENKQNNSVNNLEWLPHKQNVKYSQARKVRCIETGQVFDSCGDAAKWCGLKNHTSIIQCCQGVYKTTGGYHWEYVQEEEV